jgi:hypothetical protein
MMALDVISPAPVRLQERREQPSGLPQLFAAAIVSRQFREKLLHEPEVALANGYLGQTFALTEQERALIQSIRADSLTDLARKVNRALQGEFHYQNASD